jgi:List-Bact-rpt repeat protein
LRRALLLALAFAALSPASANASTWCGAEHAANLPFSLYGGPNVHVVYAHPSDQPDRFAQFADAIETDAEHIDAWWRGQDPSRTPRFDLYPYSCGHQLDLVSVQLPEASAAVMDTGVLWNRTLVALVRRALQSRYTTALVYYDGPSDQNFCGVGGSTSNGPAAGGLGIVLMRSCPLQFSERVAARELGGALGGVPVKAPHRCPGRDATCDDPSDLMVYSIPSGPLSNAVLDPGRDDYYGHPGSWRDMRDSPFLRRLDSQQQLSVRVAGRGSVASNLPGVGCTTSCTTQWDGGTTVALRATPARGMRFVRWSGACRGRRVCVLRLRSAKTVRASFARRSVRAVFVRPG